MPRKKPDEPQTLVAFRLAESLVRRIDNHAESMSRSMGGITLSRTDATKMLITRALDAAAEAERGATIRAMPESEPTITPMPMPEPVPEMAPRPRGNDGRSIMISPRNYKALRAASAELRTLTATERFEHWKFLSIRILASNLLSLVEERLITREEEAAKTKTTAKPKKK